MARQITRQLAMAIIRKLGAVQVQTRNKKHDQYRVVLHGVLVGHISIRRGSNREQGHDYIPGELYLTPRQARDLANCPMSVEEYIACLREKGVLESD